MHCFKYESCFSNCKFRHERGGLSPAEAPEDKSEATVWIQADGHLTRGIQLTLELYRAAKGTGGCVGHLR